MDYVSLGMMVRTRRKAMGLTQVQLAKRINMCASFVGHVERGTRKLSVETLREICVVLKLSADALLGLGFRE